MRALAARLALRVILACATLHGCADGATGQAGIDGLPPDAVATLRLIERGGPFPYPRDGAVFHNREQLLPARPRGHYREYTVPTPGARDRGARRLVVGGNPPEAFYYTEDHYRSFRRIEPRP
jgi:guanyl-specific ribonuclease Sa